MSVIIRLQNLPWSANSLDIRQFFHGLSIPEGGVHIVGGEVGDAFIAFSTDEDARQAMMMDGNMLKGEKVRLLLSSRTQMHQVIEDARKESEQARYLGRVQKSGQHPSQMPGQMGNMLGQMPGHMSGQMPGHLSGQIPGMPGMPGQMPGQMPQMGMQLPSTPEQLAALVSQMAGVPGLLESVPALAGLAPHLLGQQNQPSPGPAVSAEDVDSRVEPERKEESKRKDRRDRSRSRDRRDRSRDRDRNRDRKRGHRSRDRSRDRGSGRSRKRSRTRSRDRSKMSRDRKEDNKPQQQPLLKTPEVGPDGQFGNQKSELLLQPAVPTPVPAPVPPPLDQDNRLPIMPGMPSLPLIPGIPRMPLPPTMSGLANLAGMNIPRPGGSNLGQTEDSSKAFPSPNQDRLPGRDAWPPSLGAEPGSGNGPSRYFIGETDLRRENPLQASGRTFSGPNMDRGMDLGEGSIFDRRPMNHERSMLDNRGMTDRDRSVPGLMERNRLGPGMLERNRLGPGMMDRDGSGMMDRDRQGPGMMDRERTGSGMMDRERPGSGMMDRDRPGLGMMDRDRSGLGIMDRDRHVPGLLERDRLGPGMMDLDRGGQGGGSVERSGPGPMERDRFMHYDDRPGFMGRGGHSGVNMGGPGPYNRQGPNMMARHGPGMMDRSGPGMFDRPGGRGMVERNGPGFAERGRPGLMDRGGPGMMGRGGGPPLMGRGGPGPRMFGAGDHAGPIGMHHNGSDTDYVPHDEDMDLDEDSQDSRPGLERTDRYERHDRFDRPDRPDRPDRDRPEGRSRERRDRDRDRGRDRRSGDRDRRGYRESSRSDRDRSRSDRRDGKDEFGRDIDTRNRKDRAFESDLCVEVRDMSRNTGFADVRRFFTGFVIPSSGLKLINDSQGNRTGIAYVRFLRKRDREEALSFSGSTLKNEVVQVLPIPDEVFEKAVDSYVPPKHFADQGNQEVITLEDTDTNLTCIKCEQVPYGSKEEDLKKLCAGLQGEVFLDTSEENDGQTVAYIKFKRHEDAKKFASSKPTIQGTELCLTLCPETELSDMLINGVAEKKNDISSHGNIDRDNSLNGEQNDDLTHHSSPAKNTKEEVAVTPLDTDCVILKNLPPSVRDRDILDFFSDVGLVPVRIHVMIDTYGKPTGEAFCEFHNGVDAAKALRKDSNHMGKFIVNVVPVSRDDMNASLGAPVSNVGPMGSMGPMHMGPMGLGPRPPYNMMHQRSMGGVPRAMGILGPRPFRQDLQDLPVEGFGKPGCIIACENIPFRAEIDDILDFFAEFELTKENVIRRFDERGRATGDARVAFNNPSDAQTALHELRGKRLQGRQIFMQLL